MEVARMEQTDDRWMTEGWTRWDGASDRVAGVPTQGRMKAGVVRHREQQKRGIPWHSFLTFLTTFHTFEAQNKVGIPLCFPLSLLPNFTFQQLLF
jgi:hypothetical protein